MKKLNKCFKCKKDIYVKPVHLRTYKTHFCSKKCNILSMKEAAFSLNCVICNNIFYCQPAQVKWRKRKTCSMECRSKLARQRAEERRIKYGYTKHQIDRLIRYSPEMKQWRIAVFEQDNYTCQMCEERGGYLEADHIKPFAYFPELRFELSNGRTLCKSCHDTTKMSAKRMQELYLQTPY